MSTYVSCATGVRILFLSDTHLGFDLPRRPRVSRRRRGPDFFANFERALEPALRGEVDLVVHGGDILYRSRVPAELVARAFSPLHRVASAGIPVYLVPGNHERSRIPYPLLVQHENLHLFDRARTFVWRRDGFTLALAGFPYERGIRARFPAMVAATRWCDVDADATILVVHHAFEGARVGPGNFTFTRASDVVRARDIPAGFTAVLSGHIHRAQVLTRDLAGRPLAAPVLYPGSIERTSLAEKDERKGYLTISVTLGGRLAEWRFHELPTRPMVRVELGPRELTRQDLEERLKQRLGRLPSDAIVQLRVGGSARVVPPALRASSLRRLAPATMNVSLTFAQSPPVNRSNAPERR